MKRDTTQLQRPDIKIKNDHKYTDVFPWPLGQDSVLRYSSVEAPG